MKRSIQALAGVLLLTLRLASGDEPDVTNLLAQLQSDDLDTRYAAMRELGTVVDPLIPDACLSVLRKEGNSIRRLAARAIGSHWQQIPKERVPVFTAALKAQLEVDQGGLSNMARRGIALLNRDYDDAMASRSPNKRWVVYERHGLPCLIDTGNESEELLGFGTGAKFRPAYSNKEVAPWAIWHPKREMVALEIIEDRHHTTIWVWEHKKGLRQFRCEDSAKALGIKEGTEFGIHFASSITGWTAAGLEFAVTLSVKQGEEYIDYDNKRILWDPERDRFSALPDEVRREPAGSDAGGKPSPQEVKRHEIETNTRFIGSSTDWVRMRRDLEGDSENSFERARHLEARQLATKPAGVRRDGPALIMEARNKTEVRLIDQNADNSTATYFSYYDTVPAIDAYVIHVQPYEGESWLLVSCKTGVKTPLSELPVVSPDKQWFATASYDFAYNQSERTRHLVGPQGRFIQAGVASGAQSMGPHLPAVALADPTPGPLRKPARGLEHTRSQAGRAGLRIHQREVAPDRRYRTMEGMNSENINHYYKREMPTIEHTTG